VQALIALRNSGVMERFARIHTQHFSAGIHNSSHFLPWHREFVRRFERELEAVDPSVAVPYWDATRDQIPSESPWNQDFLGQFDAAWTLGRRFLVGRVLLPTRSQVDANRNREDYAGFRTELEDDIHNPCHNWIGGVVSREASPFDPAFYLIHAWIDLLWVQWQAAHPNAPFVSSGPGLGVNDPIAEWPDVSPADVLDHHALGYRYDVESGGPDQGPPESVRDLAFGVNMSIKDFGVFDDNAASFSVFEQGRVSRTSTHHEVVVVQGPVGDVKAELLLKMDLEPDNGVKISYEAQLFDSDESVASAKDSFVVPPGGSVERTGIHLKDHHGGDPDTANMSFTVTNTQAPTP
jgi:tyrosinase